MTVATIGAFALGDFVEAVAVLLFYQIGELFQQLATAKSRKSIADLMDIRPDIANLESEDGTISEVDPSEVPVGSIVVVRPGEKVPIDGIIESGTSSLNVRFRYLRGSPWRSRRKASRCCAAVPVRVRQR